MLLGHVGLEGLRSVRDVLSGALVGRILRIRFWRIPAAEIPITGREREVWLDREWARLDAWVAARLGNGPPDAGAPAPIA